MWEAYGTRSSVKAVQAGVPDFFVYKCVDTFLFQHDLELQYVEGDGNCLTNSCYSPVSDGNGSSGKGTVYANLFAQECH